MTTDFIEEARCKNCEFYVEGKCRQRPKGSRSVDEDGTIGEHTDWEPREPEESCSFFSRRDEQGMLKEAYLNIIDLLKKYCDLEESDYSLVATWIIGTYFHDKFESYPYLFLNAMKGSGKTRTLKLITSLSKEGEMILSPTEAVLFRTKSTLGIDEFEGVTRKGQENIRELLNACYKKGNKVKRMKQKKTPEGTTQVVEEFDVYRPLVIANISGMEDVLGDRCIKVILERSDNKKIIKLVEYWEGEEIFKKTKELLDKCSKCSFLHPEKLYTEYNTYIYTNYTNTTNNTNYTNYTQLFKTIDLMDLDGRTTELTLPLLLISWHFGPEIFENNYTSIKNYTKVRKEEQYTESRDISLIDFVSQEHEEGWQFIKHLTIKFKEFLQTNDEEINDRWMGRALKRVKLKVETRRIAGGTQVRLDILKAQKKIQMFK